LIPTLEERELLFIGLYYDLLHQKSHYDNVSIRVYCDDRQRTTGYKRNALIAICDTDYLVFFDDDDLPSPDYISSICRVLDEVPSVDCITFDADVTYDGKSPTPIYCNIRNKTFLQERGCYRRPPMHFNVIRSSIAKEYPFPDQSKGEDVAWVKTLVREGALKESFHIDKILYHYRYDTEK